MHVPVLINHGVVIRAPAGSLASSCPETWQLRHLPRLECALSCHWGHKGFKRPEGRKYWTHREEGQTESEMEKQHVAGFTLELRVAQKHKDP